MKYIEYQITLDIHKTVSPISLRVKKGDTRRRLRICLSDRGRPYHISEGCFAVFTAQKPDGNVVYNECSIEDCVIVYDMTEQTTAVPGVLECEIKLYGADNGLLTSSGFHILVEDTVYDADTEVESASEYSALVAMVTKILTNEQAVAAQQEKNEEQDQKLSELLELVNSMQTVMAAQAEKIRELEEKIGDGGCDCGGDSGEDEPGDDPGGDTGEEVIVSSYLGTSYLGMLELGYDDPDTVDDGDDGDDVQTISVVWEDGGTGTNGENEAVANRIRTVSYLPESVTSVKAASTDYQFVLTCYKADGTGLGWWHTDTSDMGGSSGLIWTSTTAISLTDIKTAVPECAYFRVTVRRNDLSAINTTEGVNILFYDANGNLLNQEE